MTLTEEQIEHWNQSREKHGLGPIRLQKLGGRAERVVALIKPLPLDQWPLWARALKAIATPEDKGIGDVLYRTIGPENSEAFKAWCKKTTGKDCGCTGRQAKWNLMYPLNQ